MIYAFMTGKKEQDHYVKAFAQSCGARIVYTKHFLSIRNEYRNEPAHIIKKRIPAGVTGIAFAGILRGNAHLFDMAKSQNLDVYYIDHAYFQRGYKSPYWMRITKNGFIQNMIVEKVDADRYKTNFGLDFKDYNFKEKSNIVILPPSNVISKVFNKSEWEENTIKELRKYTDRPIVVRRKDGPSIDDFLINPIKSKDSYVYETSLEEEIKNAYCVVAFNSSAALDALKFGVPVICERYCPAFPLTHRFDEIENLKEKERLKLFQSLACGQYTLEEARNQKTIKYLNGVRQWKGELL